MSALRIAMKGLVLGVFVLLAACQARGGNAADSISGYLEATLVGDLETAVSLSCAAWEAQARLEADSFEGVTAHLEDVSCSGAGAEGDRQEVSCSGKIVANYGEEVLEIDLSKRTFVTAFEDGQWKMCGYQ